MAIPPAFIEQISEQLGKSQIARDQEHARIVIEKPFGHDLESAQKLNKIICNLFMNIKFIASIITWEKILFKI